LRRAVSVTTRCLLGALSLILIGAPAAAQTPPVTTTVAQIGQAERDLGVIDRALDTRVDDGKRKDLRTGAAKSQQSARDAASALQDQLTLVQARLTELGSAPSAGGEAPELHNQRVSLTRQQGVIDVAMRRANLADVEAQQLLDEIDRSQAEQFGQTLATRVDSPLTPSFWTSLIAAVPRDFRRTSLFLVQGGTQIRAQWRGGWPWQAFIGLAIAITILFPLRRAMRRAGQLYLIEDAPGHRLRRSANALWRVTTGTLSPLLAAIAVVQGMRWAGLLPSRWSSLLDAFVVAAGYTGFSAAVTGAVLMRTQPSWRIAPIDDETARRLRPLSLLLAGLAAFSIVVDAFNTAIGASGAAIVMTEAVSAMLHLLLVGALLLTLGRLRGQRADQDDANSLSVSATLGAAMLVLWVAVAGALIALLLGYVGFSLFVGRFIGWTTVLGCALYLMMKVVDDFSTTVFVRNSGVGLTFARAFGVRGSVVEQFGLLLSGFLRLALIVIALGLLLSPFGTGGGISTLFGRLGTLTQGVELGGVAISPGAIVRGVVVLFVGLALVRGLMGWLENRYLPATDLDGSSRNSVSLVVRYLGIALAVLWALSSLGIGVERIALLLSALSVGIGFGLQAITQNFVSGLILLAERPIKIGDLVRVGTDEGDVKRISVRSTEIELGDHSTLIVPNSELITKSVLNKTLTGPLGRVQIQFSVPLGTDIDAVEQIVLDAYTAEDAILAEPAPSIFIDSIVDGRIVFNSFAHVSGPRAAYGARSTVFKAVLRRLRDENIDIGTVAQRLELLSAPVKPKADQAV
jgi:potassium efflux system protein